MCVFLKRVGVSRKYRADMKGIHRFFFGFGYRNKKIKKYCFGCNMIHSLKQVFWGKNGMGIMGCMAVVHFSRATPSNPDCSTKEG